MNAYIYCLRAEEHLATRPGGQVWLENTNVSQLMWRDATVPISSHKQDTIIERVLVYLKHDMVTLKCLSEFNFTYKYYVCHLLFFCCQLFIPVNANKNHWILCNVDGPNRRIQILDSFGSSIDCSDLQLTLIT
jgi:hypothetical protein